VSQSPKIIENNEGRIFLINLVNQSGEMFLGKNNFLAKLETGKLTLTEWRGFAAQRYVVALPFEDLLKGCKESAESCGDLQLANVIAANLQDEMGIDAEGHYDPELSHGTWRKDFYAAISIEESQLVSAPVEAGTEFYKKALHRLVEHGDPVIMAGALLVLEGTIPREFARIKRGRDISFTEVFVDKDDDSEETRKKKAKARLYIDDHIIHDAKAHYPDLLDALSKYAMTAEGRNRIEQGAVTITEAKKRFYDQWE